MHYDKCKIRTEGIKLVASLRSQGHPKDKSIKLKGKAALRHVYGL